MAVQRAGGYIQPLLRGLRKACFLAPCAATAQMLGEAACLMSKRALKPVGLAQTAILVVLETQCQRPSLSFASWSFVEARPSTLHLSRPPVTRAGERAPSRRFSAGRQNPRLSMQALDRSYN